MTFADRLRQLRLAANMTQAALAEASGVALPTIRNYEQGDREPLLSTAKKLAQALGVSMDQLSTFDEEAPASSALRKSKRPDEQAEVVAAPPRPRGRPRKPSPEEQPPREPPKKPRGRPRKSPG